MQGAGFTGHIGADAIERAEALLSAATEGIVFQDANGRIEVCNVPAQRILGLAPGQMASAPWMQPAWRAIREDGSPLSGEEHPAAVTLRTGQPLTGIVMGVYGPNGTLTWISVNSRPVVREGRLHGVVSTYTDLTDRKAVEHTRTANEERWKLAVAGSRDGIWDWSVETGGVFFSPRWKEILGYDEHEIGSTHSEWRDRLHPEDRPSVLAVLQSHLDGTSPFYEAEYRLKCKDGSWKWVLARGTVISRDSGGQPLRFLGAMTDITEHKKAREVLEQTQSNLTALLESTNDPIWSVDADHRILTCNRAVVENLRYIGIEVRPGVDVTEQLPAKMGQAWSGYYHRALQQGPFRMEYDAGDGRTLEFSLNPIVSGGKRIGVSVFGKDITARKCAEESLARTERQFRALTENSRLAVYIIRDGKVAYANPALANGIGYAIEEIIGADPLTFVDPRDHALVAANFQRRLAGEPQSRSYEFRARCKDGSAKHIEVFGALVEMDGHPTVIGNMVDVTARKRAEEAEREAQQQFLAVANCVPDVIWSMDLSGRFTYVSPSVERTYGWKVEELLKLTREAVVSPAEFEKGTIRIQQELEKALSPQCDRGRLFIFEAEHVRKDGTTFWAEVSASFTWSADGRPIGITGITRDATERKLMEQALRVSEQRLSSIFQESPVALAVSELETGRFLNVNPAFLGIMRASSRDQIVGRTSIEIGVMEPDDRARLAQALRANGRIDAFPVRLHRLDGEPFEAELYIGSFVEGDRRLLLASLIDVTERRRAEEERTRLAAAIEQASETIIITDASANIFYANPAFEKITGYTVAEALGKNPSFLKSDKQDSKFYQDMWNVLTRGEVWRGRFCNKRKDGTLFLEDATISPVHDESGQIVNYIAVKLDVTREAELQAQLSQAQKMECVGRLAGGVAHDFNNLLTIINGYSRLALAKLKDGDPLRDQLEEILKAGKSATELTRQLLAFSRQQVLQPRVLDLNRVVQDMESMVRRLVGEDVDVRLSLKAESAMVHADPHQLEQVVMNLAVNARDAMPRGGRLLIETHLVKRDESYAKSFPEVRPGDYVMLAVSDTGVGMDEATRQRIFEPFFTTKGTGHGTGLGLSMVQGIVAQSGGYINVYSEPGQGTIFKIYLPALSGVAGDPQKPPAAVSVSRGTETILVVEDQAKVRSFVIAALNDYGYRVIPAASAAEALTICERENTRIDLVLTDVVMPQMSGLDLLVRLAVVRPGIKTLLMSGYSDNVMVQRALLTKGAHFIEKPFSPEDLAKMVREVLGSTAPAGRILVADDETGVRASLRQMLVQGGYEVIEAADGTQALRQALAGRVDLAITDLVMPEKEGLETIQALRKDLPDIGIIGISGAFGGQFLKTARAFGADAVLDKPLSPKLLLTTVAEVLKRRRTAGSQPTAG